MALNELGLSEAPSLEVFEELGYEYVPKLHLTEQRNSRQDVVLRKQFQKAISRLNPHLSDEVKEEVFNRVCDQTNPDIIRNNKDFYKLLVERVPVEYEVDGEKVGDRARIIDFDNPENNTYTVTNQYEVKIGNNTKRIPDIVAFINGLPLIIVEAKNPTDRQATLTKAYKQVAKKYPRDIPDLFRFIHLIAVIDLQDAKIGTTNTPWEWYSNWTYIDYEGDTRPEMTASETLIRGAFHRERILDIIKNYTVYDEEHGNTVKKVAQYHQYYAVEEAVKNTLSVVPEDDENRIGTIFHTQGSGKSLSMVFYVNKVRKMQEMKNPTFVLITDRTALDDQLSDQFYSAGFNIQQATSVEDVRDKLDRTKGGIIFTLIQKFQTKDDEETYPKLNDRKDIIVIADEAHRTQYSDLAQRMRSKAIPNASYLGFTATPIEKETRSTYSAFGKEISTYSIVQSEADQSTVPIIYESRMAKLRVNTEEVSNQTQELLQCEDENIQQKMKGKWKRLSKILSNSKDRIELVCDDIVKHFNQRQKTVAGKALVVCISREAAYKYQKQIQNNPVAPESCLIISSKDDYISNPTPENELKRRFKDPDDPLKIAVVCGKWTTGFNAPCLHTLYLDRPMKNHTLMQTVGRVNRVYKDKPGGLIVDYIGIGENLKKALDRYTQQTREQTLKDIDTAIEQLHKYHNKVKSHLEPINYKNYHKQRGKRLGRLVQQALNHITRSYQKEKEFKDDLKALQKAYSLVSPHPKALEIQTDVAFFQAIGDMLQKTEDTGKRTQKDTTEIDKAMKKIVSEGINTDELVTIIGLEKTGRKAILSQKFLDSVQQKPHNIQRKILESLIRNEISANKQQNLAKYESFEKELEKTVTKYHNNHITTEEVLQKLQQQAKKLIIHGEKTQDGDLTLQERAFYDALLKQKVKNITKKELKEIARKIKKKLVDTENLDWTKEGYTTKKSAIRSQLKKILRKEGFSPKQYKPLVKPIIKQAKQFYEAQQTTI